jgi:hypothetical protein
MTQEHNPGRRGHSAPELLDEILFGDDGKSNALRRIPRVSFFAVELSRAIAGPVLLICGGNFVSLA